MQKNISILITSRTSETYLLAAVLHTETGLIVALSRFCEVMIQYGVMNRGTMI
jgi:hypothetical protein